MHSWRVPSGEVGSGFGEVRGGATSEGVFSVFHLVFNFVTMLPAQHTASEYQPACSNNQLVAGLVRVGVKIPQDRNRANVYGHVAVVH